MRIALTGGAGFIGSHLADALVAEGHEVLVIDDLSSGLRSQLPPAALLVEADVGSTEAAAAVTAFRPEVLEHHAGQVSVVRSVEDPRRDCEVNLGGLLNLLEASRRAGGLRRVIFASSGGTIYGDSGERPSTEAMAAMPVSPYGVAKRSAELYLEAFRRMYGLSSLALRYSNVFGPRQSPNSEAGVIAIFADHCLAGDQCAIFGDGGHTRDYVFVDDVVSANLAAIDSTLEGVVNVGTGVGTDLNQIYRMIAERAGTLKAARHLPERRGELRRNVLDPSLAATALGWRPVVSLAEGLDRTLAWCRAHPRR